MGDVFSTKGYVLAKIIDKKFVKSGFCAAKCFGLCYHLRMIEDAREVLKNLGSVKCGQFDVKTLCIVGEILQTRIIADMYSILEVVSKEFKNGDDGLHFIDVIRNKFFHTQGGAILNHEKRNPWKIREPFVILGKTGTSYGHDRMVFFICCQNRENNEIVYFVDDKMHKDNLQAREALNKLLPQGSLGFVCKSGNCIVDIAMAREELFRRVESWIGKNDPSTCRSASTGQ